MGLDKVNSPPIQMQAVGQGIEGIYDIPNVNSSKYNYQHIINDVNSRIGSYCIKQLLLRIYNRYRKTFAVIGNIFVILIITLILSKVFKAMCPREEGGIQEHLKGNQIYCERFEPVNRVVEDIDMNSTLHCYSSKSCVALAETLWESQAKLRYNFIIGRMGFVYVGNGFKCRSEERENALYVRLPVENIRGGYSFMFFSHAISKFREILAEGLECSKIRQNFTIATTGCGSNEEWCSRYLSAMFPQRDEIGAQNFFRDNNQPAAFFDPFTIDRVYSAKSYLVECETHLVTK